MEKYRLTPMQLDALKEVGNMGASTAATALNRMTGRRVELTVPNIDIVPLEELPTFFGGENELVTGVFLHMFGKMPGSVMLVYQRQDALRLVDLIMGKKDGSTKALADMDLSAFLETGNIMVGNYLTAIGNFFAVRFTPSPPNIIFNVAGVMVDFIQMSLDQKVTHAIVLSTDFGMTGKKIKGEFVFLVGVRSLEEMLRRLDQKAPLSSSSAPKRKKAKKKG